MILIVICCFRLSSSPNHSCYQTVLFYFLFFFNICHSPHHLPLLPAPSFIIISSLFLLLFSISKHILIWKEIRTIHKTKNAVLHMKQLLNFFYFFYFEFSKWIFFMGGGIFFPYIFISFSKIIFSNFILFFFLYYMI